MYEIIFRIQIDLERERCVDFTKHSFYLLQNLDYGYD